MSYQSMLVYGDIEWRLNMAISPINIPFRHEEGDMVKDFSLKEVLPLIILNINCSVFFPKDMAVCNITATPNPSRDISLLTIV